MPTRRTPHARSAHDAFPCRTHCLHYRLPINRGGGPSTARRWRGRRLHRHGHPGDDRRNLRWRAAHGHGDCRRHGVLPFKPGLQGDRSTGGTKPATVETGYQIQVPLFLEQGTKVKVDTRDGSYLGRVNG